MIAREVLSRAAFQAESIDPTADWDRSQWPEADHYQALNWACEQAARAGGFTNCEQDPLALGAGESTVLIAPVPLAIRMVILMPLQKELLPSSQDIENQMDPGWRTKTGIPFVWFLESGNVVKVNRKVPDATYSLVLDVLEAPAILALETDDVDPRLPAHVQNALHFAAAGYLLAQAGDYQDLKKAEALMAEFKQIIGG